MIYVNMQGNHVDLQITNLFREYDFDSGKFTD